MDEKLKNKINERMNSIPQQYKEVIDGFGWEKIIEKIGKENELYYDQMESLYIETFLVMLGLTDPEQFVYTLEEELVIDNAKANELAEDIDSKLLTPLREALLKKFPDMDDPAGEDFEDEETLQNSISNPPSSKPISFVEQKLNESHSLQKNTSPVPMPPGEKYSDPYREIF